MYGPKCFQSSKGGGSMSMRARKLGIILGCTPKVRSVSLRNFAWPKADYDDQDGARRCLTALPSPSTALQT